MGQMFPTDDLLTQTLIEGLAATTLEAVEAYLEHPIKVVLVCLETLDSHEASQVVSVADFRETAVILYTPRTHELQLNNIRSGCDPLRFTNLAKEPQTSLPECVIEGQPCKSLRSIRQAVEGRGTEITWSRKLTNVSASLPWKPLATAIADEQVKGDCNFEKLSWEVRSPRRKDQTSPTIMWAGNPWRRKGWRTYSMRHVRGRTKLSLYGGSWGQLVGQLQFLYLRPGMGVLAG